MKIKSRNETLPVADYHVAQFFSDLPAYFQPD